MRCSNAMLEYGFYGSLNSYTSLRSLPTLSACVWDLLGTALCFLYCLTTPPYTRRFRRSLTSHDHKPRPVLSFRVIVIGSWHHVWDDIGCYIFSADFRWGLAMLNPLFNNGTAILNRPLKRPPRPDPYIMAPPAYPGRPPPAWFR